MVPIISTKSPLPSFPNLSIIPSCIPPVSCQAIHTSVILERARQSTRIRKRKVALANKKKKEDRLRKNPPPLPKKVQLMLISKGLSKEPAPWRRPDPRPFPEDDVWS